MNGEEKNFALGCIILIVACIILWASLVLGTIAIINAVQS